MIGVVAWFYCGKHELVLLFQGTVKILSQIGQDTAITEQQIKIVKTQMSKIHTLKKVCCHYTVIGISKQMSLSAGQVSIEMYLSTRIFTYLRSSHGASTLRINL